MSAAAVSVVGKSGSLMHILCRLLGVCNERENISLAALADFRVRQRNKEMPLKSALLTSFLSILHAEGSRIQGSDRAALFIHH